MEQTDDHTVFIGRAEPIDHDALAAALPATVRLELVNPKDIKGGRTTELSFAEPTGKHIEMINNVGGEKAQLTVTTKIVAECCGIGPDEHAILGTRDIARLNEVFTYFLTGGSPQPDSLKQ